MEAVIDFARRKPKTNERHSMISQIRFGMTDTYTGIDTGTLSVTSDIPLAGRNAGEELSDLAQQTAPGVYSIAMSPVITQAQNAHIRIDVADFQGNIVRVNQEFSVGTAPFLFHDDFEDGNASDWATSKGTWNVVLGSLQGMHNKKADAFAPFAGCTGCVVEADVQFETPGGSVSLLVWYQDKKNYVEVLMKEEKDLVQFIEKINGSKVIRLKATHQLDAGTNYRIRVEQNSGMFSLSINGVGVFPPSMGNSLSGTVGFRIKATSASLKEITVF